QPTTRRPADQVVEQAATAWLGGLASAEITRPVRVTHPVRAAWSKVKRAADQASWQGLSTGAPGRSVDIVPPWLGIWKVWNCHEHHDTRRPAGAAHRA